MNRAIGRVGTVVVALMLVLVGMLTYLQVIHADSLANDPRNVRGALKDINLPRGPIVTADGVLVARSVPSDDGTEFDFTRTYPEGPLFQQVVGYQSFVLGSVGVERTYNDELIGRDSELQLRGIGDVFSGKEPVGTVVLSLRADLQRVAEEALGDQRGSVVAMDPTTGEILAMYSNPTYDPGPLAGHNTKKVNQYYRFVTALPDKPDLARAYRERYPPGSTFKVLTASVALETGVAALLAVFLLGAPVVHPWYLLALVPFLCLGWRPVLLLWTGTVLLAYPVLASSPPTSHALEALEYGAPLLVLIVLALRARRV